MDCIFCKIVAGEAPCTRIYEDAFIKVFTSIQPSAPIHLLLVPKEHIESIAHLEPRHHELMGELILRAKAIAQEKGLDQKGYKLVFNVGKEGGQAIPHLHLHLLGGKQMDE